MTRKTFSFALVVAALAAQAVAETPTVLQDDFISTRSREAVQAELIAFKNAGVNPWSGTYDPLKYFVSARSQQAVTQEYIAARAEVAAVNAEDSGSGWLASRPTAP